MKKLFTIMAALCVISTVRAEITPVSQGTYKVEHVGGLSDIYVKLNYATDGSYFAYVLKCANQYNPSTFSLELGKSKDEALKSIDALINILDSGNKNEIYTIDVTTTMKRQGKNLLYIYRTGEADPGYVQRRHLTATKEFLQNFK